MTNLLEKLIIIHAADEIERQKGCVQRRDQQIGELEEQVQELISYNAALHK